MVDTRGLQVNLLSALASHKRPQRVSPTTFAETAVP